MCINHLGNNLKINDTFVYIVNIVLYICRYKSNTINMKTNHTITYRGFDLEIVGYYQPEEPMVMYYKDGSGYPGCSAEFEVNEVLLNGIDIFELLNEEQITEIETLILNYYE